MSPTDMTEEERQERIDSLLEQRKSLQRTINILEGQERKYGINVPPEIPTQLREKREQLEMVVQEYEELHREPEEPHQEPEPSLAPHVPFTNREYEIDKVLSPYAPAYYLLDAPAGYGKTRLMEELKSRFEERGWICAYVSAREETPLSDLAAGLARELIPDRVKLPPRHREIPVGLWLGGALKRRWEEVADERKEGLVLLIDLDERPSLSVAEELLQEFIPQVQDCLRALEFFSNKHNRFRAVLAGRHLAGKVKEAPLLLNVLRLSPFDYKVIRDSARECLPGHAEEAISQISAHLLHMTGGHPGCIAYVLERYKESGLTPDLFLRFSGESIWREIVKRTVEEVRDSIPDRRLRETIGRLSVFRYLDYAILGRMIEEGEIPETVSEHRLADELTTTYLLTRQGRLLKDDITRRLLTLRLRHEKPQEFAAYCQQARDMCAERLQESNVHVPEKWAIEYLFQSLQQHANTVQDPAERTGAREVFLERGVPTALRMLVDERNIPPERVIEEQHVLEQALEEDWEFLFTVNYYLREDQYNDDPYKELQRCVSRFFEQKQAEGGE